jgi:hypothetical protein
LAFQTGDVEIEQRLIGTTPDALVLSDLEVWSASTGETLVPARTHEEAGRRIPDFAFFYSATYLPSRREMLVFHADVTLVRREGGVYRIQLETGRQELWLPVATTLLGSYDEVESMAVLEDRFAIFGLRSTARDLNSVEVAVYDVATGVRVFSQRLCGLFTLTTCSEPRVLAGRGGRFAVTYRNDTTEEHVLLHYRLARTSAVRNRPSRATAHRISRGPFLNEQPPRAILMYIA